VRLQSLADLSHGHAVLFEKFVDYVEYLDSKRSIETGRWNLRGLFGVLADVVRLGDDAPAPTQTSRFGQQSRPYSFPYALPEMMDKYNSESL
jgi:hypothetical protein